MNLDIHRAVLMLGSNIHPTQNIPAAITLLKDYGEIERMSSAWETAAVGSPGDHFLNLALFFHSSFPAIALKTEVLRPIETRLGRQRSADKNAPRTMDIDILIFDGQVLDQEIWKHAHLALPLAELCPDLLQPETGLSLAQVAHQISRQTWAQKHPPLF